MTMLRRRFVLIPLLLLAIGACGGGLGRHQDLDANGLFALATTEFEEGSYDNAIETLDRLLLIAGDWPRVPEARLMLARAHFAKKEFLTARQQYQRFIDRHAGHPLSPDAALGICTSLAALTPDPERDQGYTNEAIAACRNVVVDYAGLAQAREAADISEGLRATLAEKEFIVADFYYRRKMMDSAIIYFEMVANLYSETEWAPRALLGAFRANQAIGYDDLADEARERLLARYPDSEAAAEIRGPESGS